MQRVSKLIVPANQAGAILSARPSLIRGIPDPGVSLPSLSLGARVASRDTEAWDPSYGRFVRLLVGRLLLTGRDMRMLEFTVPFGNSHRHLTLLLRHLSALKWH
jgi:hypothetical protein